MKFRTSMFDEETTVIEIEKGDAGPLVTLMDQKENGFTMFIEGIPVPAVVVDGRLLKEAWFTNDHLLAIEAHEVGHIRTNSTDEPTAEREAIRLLDAAGHTAAASLLRERGII